MYVGGNWNNGSNDGLWNWNLNNAASNTNVNIGARQLIGKLILIMRLQILTTG